MPNDVYSSIADTEAAHARAARLFDEMRVRLRAVLPPTVIIQHIGATAVPGCITKGDLDIVVRVAARDFAAAEQSLAAMLSRNTGSVRTESFAAFEDASSDPPLGVQLTTIGGEFDDFHRFVEVLQSDPALVQRYNALKRAHEGKPMDDYRAAKGRFIQSVFDRP